MRMKSATKLEHPSARRGRYLFIAPVAIVCLAFTGVAWGDTPTVPSDGLSSTVVDLARLGAIGLAAIGMLLGFYLLNNGKNATAYLIMSSVFFLAALGVEAAKYFMPNQVFLAVSPSSFPNDLPPPLLMNNDAAMVLNKGKGFFVCQPNHTVSFDVQNLVDKFHDAQSHFVSAVATNVGKPDSDFGPDTDAGSRP
jgi:hypothetical protein